MPCYRFTYEVEADNLATAYNIAADNVGCFDVEELETPEREPVAMVKWKTSEVKELLEAALGDKLEPPDGPRGVAEVQGPGGDVDTERLILHFGDEGALWVSGFVPVGSIGDPSDAEVEMVEVTDGCDSRGGLNSDGMNICLGYGIVCSVLRRAGFLVVASMNDYF